MKRRTFIRLAGLMAGFGLPLFGKAAEGHTLASAAAPLPGGTPAQTQDRRPTIKVVGLGGAGGNIVDYMIRKGVTGVQFAYLNTATQLRKTTNSESPAFLRGLPGVETGGEPHLGKEWALSIRPRIAQMLKGANLVFIVAGMGGGTATGAAPVVAAVARELGIQTVAVVTTPFAFEGKRVRRARQGLRELDRIVGYLHIVPNEKLLQEWEDGVSLYDVFQLSNDMIKECIVGRAAIMNVPEPIDASGRRIL